MRYGSAHDILQILFYEHSYMIYSQIFREPTTQKKIKTHNRKKIGHKLLYNTIEENYMLVRNLSIIRKFRGEFWI